ncbi:MAG: PEP-CTERM sorting domain-containing protein [Roseiarcus sp.]
MKSNNFLKLAVARPRGAGIAAAALAACGAALAPTGAQAAGYSFQTINDPADIPPPPGAGGLTFTNLMGITSNGDTIPGFYGSGQAGDPNTGFVLTLPGKTFTSSNATFPGLAPPFNAAQTQMTAVNGNGTTFTGYTYPTNNGVPVDFQFGFYEQGGVFTMVNNPKTPDCGTMGVCDSGVITENQLIGVNNANLGVGFYNDIHGDSHGYTFDIATKTFSADINDPLAVSTVTAAINNSDEIAGFFTDPGGVIHGFTDNGGVFSTVDPTGSTETELLGLNDNGIADGFAVIGGVQHGILFDSLTDTFTILDPLESTSTTLNGLNDRGQLVGFFVDAAGNTDGVLGTPVPEPATWVMILAGFAGLGWLGLRRSRWPEVARAAL